MNNKNNKNPRFFLFFTFRETLSSAATTPTMRIHAKEGKKQQQGAKRSEQSSAFFTFPILGLIGWCAVVCLFLSHIDCAYPGQPSLIYTRAPGTLFPPDLARVMAACL